jgi:predicted metal-dependent hydrolase
MKKFKQDELRKEYKGNKKVTHKDKEVDVVMFRNVPRFGIIAMLSNKENIVLYNMFEVEDNIDNTEQELFDRLESKLSTPKPKRDNNIPKKKRDSE